MPMSLNSLRVEDIFRRAVSQVSLGKKPNISKMMREAGYSDSSAKSLKITQSKTWQTLLAQIDNQEVLNTFLDIMRDKTDKRVRLEAAKEVAKFKDLYPERESKVMGIFEKVGELQMSPEEEASSAAQEENKEEII